MKIQCYDVTAAAEFDKVWRKRTDILTRVKKKKKMADAERKFSNFVHYFITDTVIVNKCK